MKKEKSKLVTESEARPAVELCARSVAKYLRISPRKLRGVINTVRRATVQKAFLTLTVIKQKGARITEKVLKSAAANAKVLGMDENRLYIADIRADGGPSMKRVMQRSMGRADKILKRMSHLSIILKEGKKPAGASNQTAELLKKEEGLSKAAKLKVSAKKTDRAAAAKV